MTAFSPIRVRQASDPLRASLRGGCPRAAVRGDDGGSSAVGRDRSRDRRACADAARSGGVAPSHHPRASNGRIVQGPALDFEPREYEARVAAVRAAMAEREIELLVVSQPEHLVYLFGYLPTAARFQACLLPASGSPRMIVRAMDEPAFRDQSWVEEYTVFSDDADSVAVLAGEVRRRISDDGGIGFEGDSNMLTAARYLQRDPVGPAPRQVASRDRQRTGSAAGVRKPLGGPPRPSRRSPAEARRPASPRAGAAGAGLQLADHAPDCHRPAAGAPGGGRRGSDRDPGHATGSDAAGRAGRGHRRGRPRPASLDRSAPGVRPADRIHGRVSRSAPATDHTRIFGPSAEWTLEEGMVFHMFLAAEGMAVNETMLITRDRAERLTQLRRQLFIR